MGPLQGYHVEPFTPAMLPALQALLQAGFRRPFDLQLLTHKFDTAYAGHPVIGHAAYTPQGQAVAYYGLFPTHFTKAGQHYLGGQSGDSVVHPAHQGKGLSSLLLRATFHAAQSARWDFAFGFPNHNSSSTFVRKYYVPAPPLHGVLLPLGRLPIMRALHKLPGGAALHRQIVGKVIRTTAPNPTAIDPEGQLHTQKSEQYLAYKQRLGSIWVQAAGLPAWIKLQGGQLIVGQLAPAPQDTRIAAIAALRQMASKAGCESLVWYDHDLPPTLPAQWRARPLPEWPTSFADFSGRLRPEELRLQVADLDTF